MGTSRARAWILAALACATGAACKSERAAPAPITAGSAAPVVTGDDARFVIATPEVTKRDAPARFTFTEDAPPETAMDTGAYWLTAFADGRAYRLRAQNLGDWYDVDAVIGLLNAVLVARGSPLRFAVLPTGDQTAIVTAGPGPSIANLVDRGLLELAEAGDASASGKAFEDQVIEHLKANGDGPIYRDVPLVPGTGSTP